MSDLKKRLEEERDRHVAGYPGPRRDVAELLDDALSALTHPAPTHEDGSGEAKVGEWKRDFEAWIKERPNHVSLYEVYHAGRAALASGGKQ